MSTPDFEAIFQSIKDEIAKLALNSAKEYAQQAKADGLKLADSLKTDILEWSKQIANGSLDKNDVAFLIEAKKDQIKMNALKQAGLAAIKIDELVRSMLNIVTEGLLKII